MARKSPNGTAELVERQIERHFTKEILSGKLGAGYRLPSNRELAATWATSCSSVQRAMAGLTAAGLIERATSRGTFVRGRQDRALIGVLVGPNLVDNTAWYYRALVEAIQNEIDSEFLSSRIYAGLSKSEPSRRVRSQLKHLKIDAKYFNFTGFVEVSTAQAPPEIRFNDLPRVVFDPLLPDNDIIYDVNDCCEKITGLLHTQQLRRTWVVTIYSDSLPKSTGIMRAQALFQSIQSGPGAAAELIQVPIHPSGRDVEERIHDAMMRRLASCDAETLPQAIVVVDDVAMRAVILALLKHGVRIPEQLKLFTTTVEDAHVYYSVPVQRYSFPVHKLARDMVRLLRERIAGNHDAQTPLSIKGRVEK